MIKADIMLVFACDITSNLSLANLAFCDQSLNFETRVNDLIRRLTLREKIEFLVSGSHKVLKGLGSPGITGDLKLYM
ncbi:hypothetical protein Leryth_015031 [Lithospermum erythrorhizon]|nr:hypothetical protein Leryth_015031 [Lithospermum erythrorhizon]